MSATEARDRVASWRGLLVAAGCYLAADFWIWHDVALHPSSAAVGSNPSSDFQLMTWSLEWWPWAIAHGIDPLFTSMVWAPHATPTAWMTSIPALALLAAPVTALAGPLVSYNLLMLLAPLLAALCAFHLCRVLTGSTGASLVAGYVFGFSPYVLGHAFSQHLDLIMIWPLPLLVLAAVRYVRGEIGTRGLALRVVPLLIFLLGSDLELLATTLVLGGIAWLVAFTGDASLRRPLAGLAWRLAAVAPIVLAVAAPFAWLTLVAGHPPLPFAPERYATDAANLVVPTAQTVGGATGHALALSRGFVGNIGEQNGYLGLPLLGVCALALLQRRRRSWIAGAALLVAVSWSLGPTLVVAGRSVARLPISLARAPVLDMALPARIACFAALAAAVLAAQWLAGTRRVATRAVAGLLIVASLLPQVPPLASHQSALGTRITGRPPFAWTTKAVPRGFLAVARQLRPGTNVLVLPGGTRSAAGFWQAATGMRFRLAGGFTPIGPPALVDDPILDAAGTDVPPPLAVDRLRAFIARSGVGAVALLPSTSPAWRAVAIAATRSSPRSIDGIGVIRVHPAELLRLATTQPTTTAALRSQAALSPAGIDIGDVTAAAGDSRTVAAWLEFDPSVMTGVVAVAQGGAPAWTTPVVLSDPGWEASSPAVATSDAGTAAAAWVEARGGIVRIRIARSFEPGLWTALAAPSVGGVPSAPDVAVDGSGDVVAAWIEQRGPRTVVCAARWDRRGVLAGPFLLSPFDAFASPPAVVAAPAPAVAWQESDATATSVVQAIIPPGGTGPRTQVLDRSDDASTLPLGRPRLAGTLVVWTHGRGELRALVAGHEATLDAVALTSPRDGLRSVALRADGNSVTIGWQRTSAGRTALRAVTIEGTRIDHLNVAIPRGAVELPGPVVIGPDASIAAPMWLPRRGRVTVLAGPSLHVLPAGGLLLLTEDDAVRLAATGQPGDHRVLSRAVPLRPLGAHGIET